MGSKNKDTYYANPQGNIVDFVFDEHVTRVFGDMIRRSVPGYDSLLTMMGLFADPYIKEGSNIYDLGCSTGATSLALCHRLTAKNCRLIAVDNAVAMTNQAEQNLSVITNCDTQVVCADINNIEITNASVVVLNFTLQFVDKDQREPLLVRICNGLQPGGLLLLSEKILFPDQAHQLFNDKMHLLFKKANGYSDLEIAQKRTALEKVLVPDDMETHHRRLRDAGFGFVSKWFQCFNFVSIAAIKG